MSSQTIEEYIEAIYRLEEKEGETSTSELAEHLKVSSPSVSDMIKKLAEKGLISYKRYQGISLTKRGRLQAAKIIRRHRLAERFLTDILKFDWNKVHEEACKLEHAFSNEVEEKLSKALGTPATCPHGNPIPNLNGKITEKVSLSLNKLKPKEKGEILKITEETPDLLNYLSSLNLTPGTKITVLKKAPFNGPITLKIKNSTQALGANVAQKIWVSKVRKK